MISIAELKKDRKKRALMTLLLFLISTLMPNYLGMAGISYPLIIKVFLDVLIALFLLFIYSDLINKGLCQIKSNLFKYFGVVFLCFIIIFLQVILNSIFVSITDSEIQNNILLENVFNNSFISFFIIYLITSPIMETLFFFTSFKELVKNNKVLFYTISSVLYGVYYVIFSITKPIQLLFALSYAIRGLVLAILYNKYENIALVLLLQWVLSGLTVLSYIMTSLGY